MSEIHRISDGCFAAALIKPLFLLSDTIIYFGDFDLKHDDLLLSVNNAEPVRVPCGLKAISHKKYLRKLYQTVNKKFNNNLYLKYPISRKSSDLCGNKNKQTYSTDKQ